MGYIGRKRRVGESSLDRNDEPAQGPVVRDFTKQGLGKKRIFWKGYGFQ